MDFLFVDGTHGFHAGFVAVGDGDLDELGEVGGAVELAKCVDEGAVGADVLCASGGGEECGGELADLGVHDLECGAVADERVFRGEVLLKLLCGWGHLLWGG